ncbi:hypothetical protein FVP33_12885 [Lacisediminihabitans profunda]|uniref:Uncharacterized protein n=1 Tax=Lacisediminihabitans profunda TaxID=2594790 RepID=A0A5C8UQ32_9MICO|nr:hypothetical protein FVP33_12885 [Lacisediminihabitans profunda]
MLPLGQPPEPPVDPCTGAGAGAATGGATGLGAGAGAAGAAGAGASGAGTAGVGALPRGDALGETVGVDPPRGASDRSAPWAFAAIWSPATMPTRATTDAAPVSARARRAGWFVLVIVLVGTGVRVVSFALVRRLG